MTAINSNRAIRGPVTAVPVVAGKGVRLVADTENNRWVVEADETVLWEGTQFSGYTVTLSETWKNFERIKIFGYHVTGGVMSAEFEVSCMKSDSVTQKYVLLSNSGFAPWGQSEFYVNVTVPCVFDTDTVITINQTRFVGKWSSSWQAIGTNDTATVTKIVGINRVSA